jgi:uncharacterized protein (UPF0335 family)
MAKKAPAVDVATLQPDELGALKTLVKEFITRVQNVDNEIETLKEDRKELIESYKEKLDMKTLQAALKVTKIQAAIDHRDTYDLFLEVLTDPS